MKGVFLALSSFLSWPCRVLRLCPRKNEIASRRKTKAQVKPPEVSMSHHVPRVGLNTMFRGGGGRGSAKITAYRKEENDETALLEALAGLLSNFSNAKQHSGQKQESQQFAQPTPKTKSNAKGKGTSAASAADQAHDTPETGLLRSLERIIERAKREPGTLLKRLTSLVSTATQNINKKQKNQQWNKAKQMPGPTEATHEPPKKKMKASPGMSPENSSTENTTRQTSQKRPAEQTWADVVKNKPNSPENGKGKGQNKSADRSNKSPNARIRTNPTQNAKPVALLEGAWEKGALISFTDAKRQLEAGQSPTGSATLCQNLGQVQDLQRLAKLHNLPEKPFALVWTPGPETVADSKLGYLPTIAQGRVTLHQFRSLPLLKTLPKVPLQTARATDVSADSHALSTFRVTVPKAMISRDLWETILRNPRSHAQKVFGERVVLSTYGWKEVKFVNKKQQEPETLLQGFLRSQEKSIDQITKLSGKDGLFVDKLNTEQSRRPNIWWIQIKEGETMSSYFTRAHAEAKKENSSLCFRKGGSTCLGLRLQENKHMPQLHAWTLHGAPKHWFGQDVMQCLFDAGCQEAAIINPPGRHRSWLIKAVVPDENSLGVVAIHAGTRVLYINLSRTRNAAPEVVSVIRSAYQAQCTGD